MSQDEPHGNYTPTFFARQPIFDENTQVWGYELLYRHGPEASTAVFADSDKATLSVTASAFIHPEIGSGENTRILVNFTERSVLEEVPYALPAANTVIELQEPDEFPFELKEALEKLKTEGYMVAVDDFTGSRGLETFYGMADIFIVDVLNKSSFDLKGLIHTGHRYEAMLMAKRVEDMAAFRMAEEFGFSLFQGFFFQRPEIMDGRKISSNEASRLNLFRILEKNEPDFDELASMVETDVSISYRLLTYLNSAAFSFPQKIQSIKQAVVILGWVKVRNWLRVIILSDIAPGEKTSELPYLSAVRAKFLEATAAKHSAAKGQPGALFLLGLFSLLDALLEAPMEDILENVPLDEPLKDALTGTENEHSPWLETAICFENGNWQRLDSLMRDLNLDPLVVARCYYDSLLWANSFFGSQIEEEPEEEDEEQSQAPRRA